MALRESSNRRKSTLNVLPKIVDFIANTFGAGGKTAKHYSKAI